MSKHTLKWISLLIMAVLLLSVVALVLCPKRQTRVAGEFPEGELMQIQRLVDQHESQENRHRIAWGLRNPRSLPQVFRWAASERVLSISRESNGVTVVMGTSREVLNRYWFSYTNTEWKNY